MSVRVFRCQQCRHKMRFFGGRCGRCNSAKPFYQTAGFYTLAVLALLGLAVLML